MKRNLTEGSIVKALLALALPIILANIFHTVYQLTDTFWVGRLGAEAVAAVSLSFPIIFLLISLGAGLAIAGSILVAQYKGKVNQGKIDYVTAQTLALMTFISLILAVFGYAISSLFIESMNQEPMVARDAILYMRISFIGVPFMFLFFVFQAVMRGIGDVKIPLYIVITTVLLNFILDPLFILGWGPIPAYGVLGAAVSTVSTEALSAIIGITLLLRGNRGIHLRLKNLKPDFSLIKKMFKLGFPASIEQSTRSFSMVVMTFLVATFGTSIVASYGLATRIWSFIIIPAIGLAMATSTLVGQNMGAGKIERANQTMKQSVKIGFFALTIVGILFFIFAEPISAAFVPGEEAVIAESTLFLRILSLTFGFVGMQMGIIGTLRGSGNTKTAMNLSIFVLVVMLSIAYILSKHTSLEHLGIWIAYPISNVAGALAGLYFIVRGKWKEKEIT
ncbi:MATE family efflux transporter [Patescibacteria group bacterium]